MKNPALCICNNKGTDQLCSNCTADQCLCFHLIGTCSSIPFILSKSEISNLLPSSVVVQPGLCQTWLEPWKAIFLHDAAHLTALNPSLKQK